MSGYCGLAQELIIICGEIKGEKSTENDWKILDLSDPVPGGLVPGNAWRRRRRERWSPNTTGLGGKGRLWVVSENSFLCRVIEVRESPDSLSRARRK